jgi:hypothetical protein
MKNITAIFGMALVIVSACVATTPGYAQRTQRDYNTFMSYHLDNCATPTPSGKPAFGCPPLAR